MKQIISAAGLMYIFYVPLTYLASRLGYLQHRSFTSILVAGIVVCFVAAAILNSRMLGWERNTGDKDANNK